MAGGPKGPPVFFDRVSIDGQLALDQLILEGNASRIVRLEPSLRAASGLVSGIQPIPIEDVQTFRPG
jgi:hypothetical protein